MSKTTHTPGPWSAVCGQSEHKDRYTVGNTHGGIAVVEVVAEIPGRDIEPLVQIKNALLVAAAPDLLSALEGVMKWWREVPLPDGGKVDEMPADIFDAALNAIAKAKGL